MTFGEVGIVGAYIVYVDRKEDARGHFSRVWCREEFLRQGLSPVVAQVNVGFSRLAGTLRGIHFQLAPSAEVKLVRCTRGAVYDVVVDLRPESSTYCGWVARELTPDNGRMIYIPEGCGHGYQTLLDDTEIVYQTSRAYAPDLARGVRYDDPAFGIDWPMAISSISNADGTWPYFVADVLRVQRCKGEVPE